jgi:transposase
VTLNRKEQKRLIVLNEVIAGHMTGQQAAEMLDLSLQHVRRMLARYRQEGIAALAHGNRGRGSPRQVPSGTRDKVIKLARTSYYDYNDQHFTEELAERHDIVLSRSTVRRIRHAVRGNKNGRSSPAPSIESASI